MDRKFIIDKNFIPIPAEEDDELYQNGIFIFNITKMLEYIRNNPDMFVPEPVSVRKIYRESLNINESHLDSVDLTSPVILAEIAPDRYNVIDGNHRVEKAHRQSIETIMAYRIKAEQHFKFLVSRKAYAKYVEYWNCKIKDLKNLHSGRDIS
ncbi:MAG TPA: hypothetical protein PK816_17415 [Candidatus Cloacimonadota bacterium]|jgi:hypothetical protein|nr:hypothetical protein [Candidatus Cloacimonadota bacterium]